MIVQRASILADSTNEYNIKKLLNNRQLIVPGIVQRASVGFAEPWACSMKSGRGASLPTEHVHTR
jgi:hypothetical protein